MKEYISMRHGYKLRPVEERRPLEDSGLSAQQQETWREAVERLHLGDDPEITYETLPAIEKVAADTYERLPEKATVIFTSTKYPRARITADFFSTELTKLAMNNKEGKDISVAYLWESPEEASKDSSMTNVSDVSGEYSQLWDLMKEVGAAEYADDADLDAYFHASTDGKRAHPKENEILMKAVNLDLSRPDSVFKKRAVSLKEQLKSIHTAFTESEPVYFIGVGHHTNLISLDVALNGRTHYDSVDQIPVPLEMWKADRKTLDAVLEK